MDNNKQKVYDFIKDHKEVFSFQLVSYFTQRYCISADRLARFLRAEGKIMSRYPTEEEKIRHNLKTRTIIYFIPEKEQKQEYFNFIQNGEILNGNAKRV
jgi:hypothetical protein